MLVLWLPRNAGLFGERNAALLPFSCLLAVIDNWFPKKPNTGDGE